MPRPWFSLLALLAALGGVGTAVGLSACGGDDKAGDGEATIAVEESKEVELRLSDSDIDPERVRVRAGVIELIVRNEGDRPHVLAVETPEDEPRKTEQIAPGRSGRLKIDFRAGRYEMFDPLEDYRERGLEGTIVVRPRTRTRTEARTETEREVDTEVETETVTEREQNTVTETERRTVTETTTVTEPRR